MWLLCKNLDYTGGLDSVESPKFFNPEVSFSGQKHRLVHATKLIKFAFTLNWTLVN